MLRFHTKPPHLGVILVRLMGPLCVWSLVSLLGGSSHAAKNQTIERSDLLEPWLSCHQSLNELDASRSESQFKNTSSQKLVILPGIYESKNDKGIRTSIPIRGFYVYQNRKVSFVPYSSQGPQAKIKHTPGTNGKVSLLSPSLGGIPLIRFEQRDFDIKLKGSVLSVSLEESKTRTRVSVKTKKKFLPSDEKPVLLTPDNWVALDDTSVGPLHRDILARINGIDVQRDKKKGSKAFAKIISAINRCSRIGAERPLHGELKQSYASVLEKILRKQTELIEGGVAHVDEFLRPPHTIRERITASTRGAPRQDAGGYPVELPTGRAPAAQK